MLSPNDFAIPSRRVKARAWRDQSAAGRGRSSRQQLHAVKPLRRFRRRRGENFRRQIAERADALEWSSLFAHEIVFTHFHREDQARCRPRQAWFVHRLPSSPLRLP